MSNIIVNGEYFYLEEQNNNDGRFDLYIKRVTSDSSKMSARIVRAFDNKTKSLAIITCDLMNENEALKVRIEKIERLLYVNGIS